MFESEQILAPRGHFGFNLDPGPGIWARSLVSGTTVGTHQEIDSYLCMLLVSCASVIVLFILRCSILAWSRGSTNSDL